jgi:hypothetical protein
VIYSLRKIILHEIEDEMGVACKRERRNDYIILAESLRDNMLGENEFVGGRVILQT